MAQDRISVNPEICSGKPTIKGTRIMVRNILSLLGAGYSAGQVLEEYPELTLEDIQAAVNYATELVDEVRVIGA